MTTFISKKELLDDKDTWNALIAEKVLLGDIVVEKIDLKERDFSGYKFTNITFQDCLFTKCNFKEACFSNTRLSISNDKPSRFVECDFSRQYYAKKEANFNNAILIQCILKNTRFDNVSFRNSFFFKSIFTGSHFYYCNFNDSSILISDLQKTKLKDCDLNNTKWENTIINPQTEFQYCFFDKPDRNVKHDVLNDQSDKIKFSTPYQIWNWKLISKIGRVPALEFSWTLFGLGLFLISTIIFINESKFISEGIEYPIPIPFNLKLLTAGALCASIGTFLYRARCPDRIQNFTENEWVEGHGHPRLFYREYCLKNIKGLAFTTFFLAIGISVLGYLILTRAWYVLSHL